MLLSIGYFPKELPPPFATSSFASYITTQQPLILTPPSGQKSLVTKPAIYNLACPGGQRRRLHILNPFSYYKVCDLLERHWTRIEKHCRQSRFSLSTPIPDVSGFRALKPESDGAELAIHRARIRSTSRFILRTDITRFYGSIYTHSIPWALDGKAVAKKVRKGGFANDLDEVVRDLQDGQTLGIPIGPDASLVLAEIIASASDRQLQDAKFSGIRFMDDYEMGFASRSAAEAGLAKIEEELADFELAINPRKTMIDELPVELDRRWNLDIKTYNFRGSHGVSASELIRYFNRVFEWKTPYPYDPVLAYAVTRLRSVTVHNWDLLQDLLCQCALVEPSTIEPVVTLLQENSDRGLTSAIDKVIANTLDHHAPLSHSSELAWALWAAVWFKRPIATKLARKLDGNPDPVVALLALHAKEIGLIKKSVKFNKWAAVMTLENLYDTQWLLAYEADLKGWVPSASKANHVDNDPNFSQLKAADVSFYDAKVTAPTKSLLLPVTAATLTIYADRPER